MTGMYRIVLLAAEPEVESRVDRLLRDRMKGRYLMKVLPGPDGAVPLINGKQPSLVLASFPGGALPLNDYLARVHGFAGTIPVVLMIEAPDEDIELTAMQAGAQECVVLNELTARSLARVVRNSVERSRVEEKLAREQEMFGNLLAKLPDRIYFKDLDSRFVRVNKSMADYFRVRDPEAVVGRTDHDFFTPEHSQPALEDERQIIRTGEPIIDKLERETLPNGDITWALTSKLPLRNAAGEITGTFGISHDVTAMKRLEETIEAERSRLEELSEELSAKNIQLEGDLVMAKGIQEAMLPGRHCVFPAAAAERGARVECSSVYRPAEAVGGDFFTLLPLGEDRVGILICDIMGHGLRAALGTAIMRGLVEELKSEADRPDHFLGELNRGLRGILRNIDEPLLVTACYLIASATTDEVLLSSAGHPLPVIIHRATHRVEPIGTRRSVHGPALALFDDASYGMESFRLSPDDLILLFTDGAVELSDADGREFGFERFMAAAGKYADLDGQQLCERVLDEIQLEAGSVGFEDDVCLLAVERRPAEDQFG